MSYVDDLGLITELEVVQDGSLGQVTKGSAVINTVELSGVEALSVLLIDDLLLNNKM